MGYAHTLKAYQKFMFHYASISSIRPIYVLSDLASHAVQYDLEFLSEHRIKPLAQPNPIDSSRNQKLEEERLIS